MPKTDSFDDNVDRYESWFERNRLVYESELEAIRDLLQPCGRGLEIGVGTGRFAAPLGLRFGVDPSLNMGKVAIRRGIEVILGIGEKLPFKESSFDVVLLVTTICFLDNVPAALKEAYRVLKDNGNILIGFIDRESSLGKMYEAKKEESAFYKLASFFSADEVVWHLRQAGFENLIFNQTIFEITGKTENKASVKPGYGEGSFMVVRGKRSGS